MLSMHTSDQLPAEGVVVRNRAGAKQESCVDVYGDETESVWAYPQDER